MSEGLETVQMVGGDYDGETWQVSIGQQFLYVPRLDTECLRFEFATYTRRATNVMALAGMSDQEVGERLAPDDLSEGGPAAAPSPAKIFAS
jgi:hypothetical protein